MPIRRVHLTLLAGALTLLAACSSSGGSGGGSAATTAPTSGQAPKSSMTVTSSAFADGAAIPVRYTCKGDNLSPPLKWSAPPAGTTQLALVVDDPDGPGGTFVHWVLSGIPAGQTGLAENTVPQGALQGRNSAGRGYTGPCPPSGPAHHYRFTIYALSRPQASGPIPTRDRRSRRSRPPRPRKVGWSAPSRPEAGPGHAGARRQRPAGVTPTRSCRVAWRSRRRRRG